MRRLRHFFDLRGRRMAKRHVPVPPIVSAEDLARAEERARDYCDYYCDYCEWIDFHDR